MPKHKNTTDSVLTFPCSFQIKVMGKANSPFESSAISIVRKHCPTLGEAAISSKLSNSNTYCSLTFNITATSQTQLDAIYTELSACELVLMAL